MNGFRFADPAQEDLDEIWHHHAAYDADFADLWVQGLLNELPLLAKHPRLGTLIRHSPNELRKWAYRKYLVFYNPLPEGIFVSRIIHGAQEISLDAI